MKKRDKRGRAEEGKNEAPIEISGYATDNDVNLLAVACASTIRYGYDTICDNYTVISWFGKIAHL